MDRLDTWLNAQRGWRRLALIGLATYAPIACLGFGILGFFALFELILAFGAAAIVAIAALALPAAVGLGSISAAIYSRRARNPKRRKGQPPFFMWRFIALAVDDRSRAWPQRRSPPRVNRLQQ